VATIDEIRIPDQIKYGAIGGPGFKTTIFQASSGVEQRNVDWQDIRAQYNIGHAITDKADLDPLIAFFYARRGRAYGFRFKDYLDFEITGPQQIGVGDGVQTAFQVFKRYDDTVRPFDRVITKLVSGTVTVYLDGTPQVSGFTVNLNTGIVTFTAAPSAAVIVGIVCEFDVPVRFDVDDMGVAIDSFSEFNWDGITLVEVR